MLEEVLYCFLVEGSFGGSIVYANRTPVYSYIDNLLDENFTYRLEHSGNSTAGIAVVSDIIRDYGTYFEIVKDKRYGYLKTSKDVDGIFVDYLKSFKNVRVVDVAKMESFINLEWIYPVIKRHYFDAIDSLLFGYAFEFYQFNFYRLEMGQLKDYVLNILQHCFDNVNKSNFKPQDCRVCTGRLWSADYVRFADHTGGLTYMRGIRCSSTTRIIKPCVPVNVNPNRGRMTYWTSHLDAECIVSKNINQPQNGFITWMHSVQNVHSHFHVQNILEPFKWKLYNLPRKHFIELDALSMLIAESAISISVAIENDGDVWITRHTFDIPVPPKRIYEHLQGKMKNVYLYLCGLVGMHHYYKGGLKKFEDYHKIDVIFDYVTENFELYKYILYTILRFDCIPVKGEYVNSILPDVKDGVPVYFCLVKQQSELVCE